MEEITLPESLDHDNFTFSDFCLLVSRHEVPKLYCIVKVCAGSTNCQELYVDVHRWICGAQLAHITYIC